MNCVVCAMAKNEHLYINDWVKHYLNIGFSHIYLFDNDDNTSPQIIDYIDNKYLDKVTIFNVRGRKEQAFQKKNYKKFYDEYKDTFDWCLFCDIDEFLFGIDNINKLVNNIPGDYNQIRIKWRLFGDDDLVERDLSVPVYNAFKKELKYNKLAKQGKAIIRGGLTNVFFNSVHYGACDEKETILVSCLPSGKKCTSKVEIEEDYTSEVVYLNHYMTKTISEFINQKYNRGDAIFKSRVIDLSYFWNINRQTESKLKWLRDAGILKAKPKGIDLVVPYVDSTDPEWVKLFNKYNPIKDREVEAVNAKNRFRGQGDFFRFFFRGIDKFAPWVGEVYLLVQSESQVPAWIDRNKVTVVLHEQFIPSEYLPTFNSTTIEMFLWNIPRLSEKFVYANDDFFITNIIPKSCLFQDVNAVTEVYRVTRLKNSLYQNHIDNSYKEIYNNLQNEVMTVGHTIRPYFKSDMKECYDRHKDHILKSISRFRESKNFNVYLFTFDLMRKGKLINERRVIGCSIRNAPKFSCVIDNPKMLTIIQDVNEEANIYENKELFETFKKKFPSRSRFERPGIGLTKEKLDKIENIVSKVPDNIKDSFRRKLMDAWSL